jgi:FtsP/CotA-like multicopper oxidase with cupredoxin domain
MIPRPLRLQFLFVASVLLPLLGATRLAVAQAPVPPQPTNNIQPTITAEMGDLGGKFFGRIPEEAKTRHYYIAAEPELWDYTPQGRDPVCGKPLPPPILAQRRMGKIRYVQYTDATFASKMFQPARLGILGPVLRGVVGEYLAVTFLNRGGQPLSIHPHGVKYDKDSEGSYYEPRPGRGAAVGAGAKFTYIWQLDAESGPMPSEPSSKGWLYHSHVNGDEEANFGLIGSIIVTDPKRARPDGTPSDVDREQAALFMIFDESGLGEAEREAAEYASLSTTNTVPVKPWWQTQELLQQGQRHTINGFVFGNLPGLEANEGERVRWYLYGLGSETDFHTAHWHGLRVLEEGRRRTDVVELLPATMKVADMNADNPGSWLFHCHVSDHMTEGMFARFTVHPKGGAARAAAPAFFGLAAEQSSLRVDRAEARLDASSATIQISGVVTVFDAFSVFTQPVTFQLLQAEAKFMPDRKGQARNSGGQFQVRNAGQYGVVYGGKLEFDVTLQGREWREALDKQGVAKTGTQTLTVPLRMVVGNATHSAGVELRCVVE